MTRPVSSYVMQRPMTRRDWAMAMCAFAAMGLTGCGLVDAIDDAAGAQVQKITGPAETDTTTVCKVAK